MSKIKRIDALEIENVKGISHRAFELGLIRNKPTLLVAPNGFGKSSVAAAFGSLRSTRLELHKDHFHKGDPTRSPKMIIRSTLEDGTKHEQLADSAQNTISGEFDVQVIASPLIARAKKLKISGNTIVTPSLEVAPVTLVSKIPDRATWDYKHPAVKVAFGKNGKVLPNIRDVLSDKALVCKIIDQVDFSKAGQVTSKKVVDDFRTALNGLDGSVASILGQVDASHVTRVFNVSYVGQTVALLKEAGISYASDAEYVCAALQVSDLYESDRKQFRKVGERYRYELTKAAYERDLSYFHGTWKSICPKEDKKRGLVVDFPPANQISNGERDVICFVSSLIQARSKFKKSKCVLVIDEVFDYLDDANLVACQYYLTQMIEHMKAEGRQFFPLIMTHLDPGYFKNFCFGDQKVCYLNKGPSTGIQLVEKMLLRRDDPSIQDPFAAHFLHYHPVSKDLASEFSTLGIPVTLAHSNAFTTHVEGQLKRYLDGEKFDPIAVCCAVRNQIEQTVCGSLPSSAAQTAFLSVRTTSAKLEYASEIGVDVPEIFYMLGIIYNDAMHPRKHQDNVTPLMSKLSNLTIKTMIRRCLEAKC